MTSAIQSKHCELFPNAETEAQVVALFKVMGITQIKGEYSGSGDSSDLSQIEFEGGDDIDEDQKYEIAIDASRESYGVEKGTIEKRSMTLQEIGEFLMWSAIDLIDRSGFYNNEGGYGYFKVDLTTSPVSFGLDHYDNITKTERTTQGWKTGTEETDDGEDLGFDDASR